MISRGTGRKRVLIVDDEPVIRQLCQRVLTKQGFEVDTAANGRAAQPMISKQKYDIFLFDMKMPLMDGRELYQWLEEVYPQIINRVAFTTGSAIGQDTESFLQNSGRQVMLKPFTTEELIMTVTHTLEAINK